MGEKLAHQADELPDPEEQNVVKSHLGFPVVGIGASAGGLSALRRLFADMAADSGMAFVVVMHLSPDHESSLGEILQRSTRMPVVTVAGSVDIAANHIYVISPSMRLTMNDGQLRVAPLTTIEGRRQSIDLFYRSLAHAHRERAVCIVLSGTGSDGSQGLTRLKELGGVTLVQSPEDAEFDGMPTSAIATGLIDFTLPVSEMPQKLLVLWANAREIELPNPPPNLEAENSTGDAKLLAEEALLSIKALLRERTGHDFTHYKRGTVLRRLERRMQVNAVPDLPSYRRLLDVEPRETPALLQDMLISVTNFFRDPDAYASLGATLQDSLAEWPAGRTFRAWVAGCATGEEAYSVAMVLQELLWDRGAPVQLFASDIDRRAVASARPGLYPPSIATDVSAERLRRFFSREPAGYRIDKGLRDSVVFSAHNVLTDPPFTRVDLICCRNLLIYLDRAGQAQLLRSFHFGLKPGGLLFLGSSESTEAADGLFKTVDKVSRLYRASPTAARAAIVPPVFARAPAREPSISAPEIESREKAPLESLHERVTRGHGPPTVLIDGDDSVLHVDERAAHLLRVATGAPSNKLLDLARPELRAELRAALARALDTRRPVEARRVRLAVNGEQRIVAMTATPVIDETPAGLVLVVFHEFAETMTPEDGVATARDPLVDVLEAELRRTQERLRVAAGESAAFTQELRASNEELQTINEELRSTTEELETSQEELQSTNEELTTVNYELALRVEETGRTNDDLQNLMVSAEIGTVFVDREMRIKRFTPQAASFMKLLPSDEGRALTDIRHHLEYPELESDAVQAMRALEKVEREVRSDDGRWFLARVLPYRTSDDRIEGAALAFVDVTARRTADEALRQSEQRMRRVAESMREYAILTMDEEGVLVSWSAGAVRIFGFESGEAIGQRFDMLFTEEDRANDEPANELRLAREAGRAGHDRWMVHKDGRRLYCSGITTPMIGTSAGYAKIARDLTGEQLQSRKRDGALEEEQTARARLQERSAMKDEFLAVMSHELKNPLAVIQMNAQLLQRISTLKGEARAEKGVRSILSAVASQAQIINDLLELSRLNIGKVTLEPVPLDLSELFRGIAEAVAVDVDAKHQRLSVELPDSLRAFADPVRIEQIVWNLLSNAVKFTPEDGSIDARLSLEGSMAVISVRDSGIGIDPGDLINIFEMFRQVNGGANRRQTGLGIGLALVRQLAELHHGRVEARSEGLGRGAEFIVWLPIAGQSDAAPRLGAKTAGTLAGLRLLLVDDEPDLLEVFTDLIRDEGATVTPASSATEALELARSGSFDAVISDIAMPERDGYWLATELRRDRRFDDLTLVAVSGMARTADRQAAIKAGFDAHVGKPLDLEQLSLELLAAVARRRTGE